MPRKNALLPHQIFTAASMTGTSTVTSLVTNIQFLDNMAVQLQWTGTPTGTFYVQGSLDYSDGTNGKLANAGTWTNIMLPQTPLASGSAGQILIDMALLSFPWIRVQYTNTSGTGSLDAYICGKEI